MNHFVTSAFLVFIFTLAVGIYFILQPRSLDRLFGSFWLSVAFWTCLVGMQFQILSRISGHLWGWFLHVGCISVPVIFCHFALCAAGRDEHRSIALKAAYVIAVSFVLLNTFTDLFTQGTIYQDQYAYPKPAILYPVYILFFQAMGIWSVFLILKWGKKLQVTQRKDLYLFLALHALAYVGAMDNFLIMYDIRIFPLYPYGLYLILPYAIFGSYAFSKLQTTQLSSSNGI